MERARETFAYLTELNLRYAAHFLRICHAAGQFCPAPGRPFYDAPLLNAWARSGLLLPGLAVPTPGAFAVGLSGGAKNDAQ